MLTSTLLVFSFPFGRLKFAFLRLAKNHLLPLFLAFIRRHKRRNLNKMDAAVERGRRRENGKRKSVGTEPIVGGLVAT